MKNNLPIVYYINNTAPLYREAIWSKLLASSKMDLHFIFGTNPNDGIETIDFKDNGFSENLDHIHRVQNYYVKNKYLIWQKGFLLKCLTSKVDVVILLGEFVIASNWLISILCRLKGIIVIHKGHGMYGNEKGLKLFLRKTFYKLADKHLVYERRSKKIMTSQGFNPDSIHILFNSLDYDTHKAFRPKINALSKKTTFNFFKNPELPTLLFVGRLTKIKKIRLLLEAASRLNEQQNEVNVLLVGDGSQRQFLEEYAAKILTKGSYHFYGASYDENINAELIALSDICVSPGNVGLTAIHSLSYGTPVCTHSNFENQMPEVEALEHGITGIFFKENDLDDMALQLKYWLENKLQNREEVRSQCYKVIDTYYNPYYQVGAVENMVLGNKPLL